MQEISKNARQTLDSINRLLDEFDSLNEGSSFLQAEGVEWSEADTVYIKAVNSWDNHVEAVLLLSGKTTISQSWRTTKLQDLTVIDIYGYAERRRTLLLQIKAMLELENEAPEGLRENLPALNWHFVDDETLRGILERDYAELQGILKIPAPKSALVMCGSILEAVLVSILRKQGNLASDKFRELFPDKKSPTKPAPPLESWKLYQLISVAASLGILRENDSRLHADILRDYRNLIHPMVEVRQAITIDHEIVTAVLALFRRVLKLLSM